MKYIDLQRTEYGAIIQFAVEHGYHRSRIALEREAEEGSIGQYGITLDEAVDYIHKSGLTTGTYGLDMLPECERS